MDIDTLKTIKTKFNMVQDLDELLWLTKKLDKINIVNTLEIGVERGGALEVWRNYSKVVYGIDVDLSSVRRHCFRKYDDITGDYYLIRGSSDSKKVRKKLSKKLSDNTRYLSNYGNKSLCGSLQFVFIDGDHSYDFVKQDFELYSKFVLNGVIALHDINNPDVNKLWKEIKKNYKTDEITKTIGTGIVYI